MRDFEIAWLYPAEALSPCDGMVHRWDEHQHMMTTEGEAPVPRFPTAKGGVGGCQCQEAAILACLMLSQLKEIIIIIIFITINKLKKRKR